MQITPPPSPERENLAGLVERVTFHNEDSGFCVLRVKARGQRDLITVIGHAAAIGAGEFVQASGRWVNDRTHGVQFRADFLRAAPPTTAEGIEKYLASGMIKGIGPIYAKKLVKAFREQVFDVIEQTPTRLKEIDGIGPKRADSIVAAWADQKAIRDPPAARGRSDARRLPPQRGARARLRSARRRRDLDDRRAAYARATKGLSLIHISEPTRLGMISYAV